MAGTFRRHPQRLEADAPGEVNMSRRKRNQRDRREPWPDQEDL